MILVSGVYERKPTQEAATKSQMGIEVFVKSTVEEYKKLNAEIVKTFRDSKILIPNFPTK